MEPGDNDYQMKPSCTLDPNLQPVLVRKVIASSGIYYLILMWLIRAVIFLLWVGKRTLIWLLRVSFLLIREGIRRYLGVTLLQLTLVTPSWPTSSRLAGTDQADATLDTTSPLLPIVAKDRVQICEENFALEDRERLLFEFEKVVAPQVSVFQLGEIIVPIDDTRQLATFLKLKLTAACNSHRADDINKTILGAILNIRTNKTTTNCVVAESRDRTGSVKHAVVYVAARLIHGARNNVNIHLVLVGIKVERFLGSSEFRTRFNPPRTRRDKKEWQSWTLAHLRALRESVVDTAEELLALGPVHAEMW